MFRPVFRASHFLSTVYQSSRSYFVENYPFRENQTLFTKLEKSILPAALSSKASESMNLAHDYLKLLMVKQDLENLSKITRPQIFEEIKKFIENVNNQNLQLKALRGDASYTNIDTLLKYDQLLGINYNSNPNDYNMKNLLGKQFFKKILCVPKAGLFKMRSLSSIIVVDVVFTTTVKAVVVDPATNQVVCGKDGDAFEKCIIEFTTNNKYKDEPMILSYLEKNIAHVPKDQLENGWKISNINMTIELPDLRNLFDHNYSAK